MPGIETRRAPARLIASDDEALDVARALAGRFAEGAAHRDRARAHPRAEIDAFSASGLWGITVPPEHGGAGVSAATLAEITAIISEADPSIGQIPQNHWYMVEAIKLDGTDAQRRAFLPRILDGQRIGNAYSERNSQRAADHQTTLLPTPDGLRLNGTKYYCSGVLHADWIAAVARDPLDRVVIAFVAADQDGVTIVDDWFGFGQRTTASGTTIFENVPVDPANVVAHWLAFERPTHMGPFAQIIHAAVDLGIARAAFADLLVRARRARPWVDNPTDSATEDPYTLASIGRLKTDLDAATAMLARAGHAVDDAARRPGEDSVAAASLAVAEARILTNDVALAASNVLFELAGTRATLAEHNLDRHWRNARTHTLHDPVRWKYHAIGNFHLNGTKPPRYGAL